MRIIINYIKSILFPDLYTKEIEANNSNYTDDYTSRSIDTVDSTSNFTSISGKQRAMIDKSIIKLGLSKNMNSKGIGVALDQSKLSDEHLEFVKDFGDNIAKIKTQEDSDQLFGVLKEIIDDTQGVFKSIVGKNPVTDKELMDELILRDDDDDIDSSENKVPKVGTFDGLSEEVLTHLKDTFIESINDHFDESPFMREVTNYNESPFKDLTYLPDAFDLESGREVEIINKITNEFIDSGDTLRCSKVIYNMGLNYNETHFGGMIIGYLRGCCLHNYKHLKFQSDDINQFFGNEGIRKLERIGFAFGIKRHLPNFNDNEFNLYMNKFLQLS